MKPGTSVAILALVSLAGALGYLGLAPAVVNGDGLGYLKAALDGTLYPGHLAYVPLLMMARRLAHAGPRAVEGLVAARLASALAAAIASLSIGATARRIHGSTGAGLLAAAGLLASWGSIAAGSDVESYAPALAALCAAIYFLTQSSRGVSWAMMGGACVGIAALFHVENVLFALPAMLLAGRRHALPMLAVFAFLVAGAYALVLPAHGALWLGGASHGLHYPLRWTTPAIAIYGACKALVYSPYPYEASWPRVLGQFAVGAILLALLLSSLRGARATVSRAVLYAWLLPYALVGCAFYASDAERWTFLLPLLWLCVAGTTRPNFAFATVAAVALANAISWIPIARDDTMRTLAARAGHHLADGDLVIGPGHGWDEYIGFYEGPRVVPFPLVYYAGALGGSAPLKNAITLAAAAAPRVFVTRFNDARILAGGASTIVDDGDPAGWKELRLFGITRENARGLLPPGNLVDAGDGLQRLLPGNQR